MAARKKTLKMQKARPVARKTRLAPKAKRVAQKFRLVLGSKQASNDKTLRVGKHHSGTHQLSVQLMAQSVLPTRAGRFQLWAFDDRKGLPHLALTRGKLVGAKNVPVRLHSQCLTGDALGSRRCDCREQLESAMVYLGRQPRGVLLYLGQEGRGIGLTNKIRAYALQDMGADTVEANQALGFAVDARDYDVAAGMLRALGVQSVQLMTNNPHKVSDLQRHGIEVVGRIAIRAPANRYDRRYLKTKKEKLKHWLK